MAKTNKNIPVSIVPTGMQVSGSDTDLNIGDKGRCQELINMRHKDGSWQVVGDGSIQIHPYEWDDMYKHPINETLTNLIGYDDVENKLKLVGSNLQDLTNILTLTEPLISISHLNNILLVFTASRTIYLLWDFDTAAYVSLPQVETPTISVDFTSASDNSSYVYGYTGGSQDAFAACLGNYIETINSQLKQGYVEGHFFIRLAYRLFDGSYIMHSHPHHVRMGEIQDFLAVANTFNFAWDSASGNARFANIKTGLPKLKWLYTAQQKTNLRKWKGVIQGIDIFFSPIHSHYINIETSTFYDLWTHTSPVAPSTTHYFQPNANTDAINECISNAIFYKVSSISFEKLTGTPEEITVLFPENIETKPILPVDSFSHHLIAGRIGCVFNSRLHLGNIKTTLGYGDNIAFNNETGYTDYFEEILGTPYAYSDSVTSFYVLYELHTEFGTKSVLKQLEYVYVYEKTVYGEYYVFFNPVLCYPDKRCVKIQLLQKFGNTYYLMQDADSNDTEYNLTPHPSCNFAYYNAKTGNYNKLHIIYISYYDNATDAITGGWTSIPTPTEDKTFTDPNRVQVSLVDNPFVLPAENSYQVKNTEAVIRAMATTLEAMSEGQYGEYPLYIFTSNGIWALQQGQGDVLYSNIFQVSDDECYENKVMPIGNAVAFLNDNGLFAVSGRNVQNLSELIIGTPRTHLTSDEYQNYIEHATLVELSSYISTDDFLTYITDANMAYRKHAGERELYISNPAYNYTYVLDVVNQYWYKRTGKFDFFVNEFPGYSGFDKSTYYLIGINDETQDYKDVLIQTRPIMFGAEARKYLEKAIMRGEFDVDSDTDNNKHCAFYIFGSANGTDWSLVVGKKPPQQSFQDIVIRRTHVPVKYFIFLFIGTLKNSFIYKIDSILRLKYQTRLR